MSRSRSPRPRRPYHHGDLRRALLDAAARLLADGSADALTLRQVAAAAGVSHAAPAHHFGDKAGLLAAVAAEGFVRLTTQMAAARDAAADPVARLAAIGSAYVGFAGDHEGHFRVMFSPLLAEPERFGELRAAAWGCFALLVDAARATGHDAAAPQMALLGWCLAHGLSTLWHDGALASHPAAATPLPDLAQQLMTFAARSIAGAATRR